MDKWLDYNPLQTSSRKGGAMAKDSELWKQAYEAHKKHTYKPIETGIIIPEVVRGRRIESMVLMQELREIKVEVSRLKVRSREIRKLLVGQKLIKGDYYNKPIKLYGLRLEDGCYYVGMSRNPERRFKKHGGRKGAVWPRLHKPIEILEVRDTGLADDRAVSKLEDDMTLEYAMKYGSEYVRGGGYCQRKPHWPDVVIQNE